MTAPVKLRDEPNIVSVVENVIRVTVPNAGPAGGPGPQGDPGVVVGPTPPGDTSLLWVDTS